MRRPFADRREELGLSLESAAARLRISPGYLCALERGRAPLSAVLAARMAVQYASTLTALTLMREPSGQLPFQKARRQRARSRPASSGPA